MSRRGGTLSKKYFRGNYFDIPIQNFADKLDLKTSVQNMNYNNKDVKMENNIGEHQMEILLSERSPNESFEYEQGIFDMLIALFDSTDVKENKIRDYAKDISLRRISLKDVMDQEGLEINYAQALFSEDLIIYPTAVSNISEYLVEFGVNMDTSSEDALMEAYKVFAKVFEELLETFNDEIGEYLKVNGKKIGALISMTYVTLRVLYKGSLIRKEISMIKSASFFDKKGCAIKRLIYRFRKSKVNLMRFLENGDVATLDEIIERIKSIRN